MTKKYDKHKYKELQSYFNNLNNCKKFSKDEEYKYTKQIKNLEIELWLSLLSYQITSNIISIIDKKQTKEIRKLLKQEKVTQENWKASILKLANNLYKVDHSRKLVRQVYATAYTFAQERGINDYVKQISQIKERLVQKKQAFTYNNLKLSILYSYRVNRPACMSHFDVIQEGNIGLLQAVDSFDPDLGYRFSTYALKCISHHVHRAIEKQVHQISMPVVKNTESGKRSSGVLMEEISGNILIGNEEELIMTLPAKENYDGSFDGYFHVKQTQIKEEINRLQQFLSSRECDILRYRYLKHEYSLEKTGNLISAVATTVSTIEKGALEKMRLYVNPEYKQLLELEHEYNT